jgi:cell division protein FtsL
MRTPLYVGLFLALIASGIGTIYTEHLHRKFFVDLNAQVLERDAMEDEWGRLLLERALWAGRGRIEHIARERLELELPLAADIVLVIP